MLRPIKSCVSLRALLVVMIAAPIVPTIGLAPAILIQLGHSWHQLTAIGQLSLLGMGMRVLGGCLALMAAGRLIRATRALSRAARELNHNEALPAPSTGVVETDEVIRSMAAAARSLAERSKAYDKAEAGRRDSEARLHDFAECGSDWYWETDREHRFCYLSDHIRGFGQDPTSRLGRARWELVSDADRETVKWRDHRAALERHQPFRDFRYTRKVGDQPEQTVSVSGRPIFDAAGSFAGYRGTARDISEEVRAERLLREAKTAAEAASLAKSRFLANMSHELRTPLNAILGFSEMLERGDAGLLGSPQRDYVGYIRESGAHLLDIIDEILDLAKIDAGKMELNEDCGVDARAVADRCIALIGERPAAGGLDLRTEIEVGLPRLIADETRLKQILLNLLGNAVKFTEPGGIVALVVRRAADGGVEFVVRDTGLGMSSAEVEIALEPFGQVDAGLARQRDGTGLGLPLARRLTELHGGSFTIESHKGQGTTITVGLPASRMMAAEVARATGMVNAPGAAEASPVAAES
jgi:PAS domain S-box-containing protein